jgi:hypothetical protein
MRARSLFFANLRKFHNPDAPPTQLTLNCLYNHATCFIDPYFRLEGPIEPSSWNITLCTYRMRIKFCSITYLSLVFEYLSRRPCVIRSHLLALTTDGFEKPSITCADSSSLDVTKCSSASICHQVPKLEYMLNAAPRVIEPSILTFILFFIIISSRCGTQGYVERLQ